MKTTRECGIILANLRTRRREAGTGPYPIAVQYSEGPLHFYRAYYLNGRIAVAVRDGEARTDPEFLARVSGSLSDPCQEVDTLFLPWWLPCIHPQYTYARSFSGLLGMALILVAIGLAWHYIPGHGLVYHWSTRLEDRLTDDVIAGTFEYTQKRFVHVQVGHITAPADR